MCRSRVAYHVFAGYCSLYTDGTPLFPYSMILFILQILKTMVAQMILKCISLLVYCILYTKQFTLRHIHELGVNYIQDMKFVVNIAYQTIMLEPLKIYWNKQICDFGLLCSSNNAIKAGANDIEDQQTVLLLLALACLQNCHLLT